MANSTSISLFHELPTYITPDSKNLVFNPQCIATNFCPSALEHQIWAAGLTLLFGLRKEIKLHLEDMESLV